MTSSAFTLFVSFVLLSIATIAQAKLQCSVPNCTKAGAKATCYTFDGHIFKITTCSKWAVTAEGKEQCKIKCTGSCFFVPIYGSDGATYCRLCDLYRRACETRFRVTGPVLKTPQLERTEISLGLPTPPSRQVFPALQCSMQVCTFFGADYTCLYKETGQPDQERTCGEYAATIQSQDQCQFVCTQSCDAGGPYDNERTQYCSLCHLRLASCAADYAIYGPYLVPGIEECSEEYCSTYGDDAKCLPSRFNTVLITCAEWNQSN